MPDLDGGARCHDESPGADWVRIELADVPSLRVPGASAIVERPDAFLNVWVQHQLEGCFTAVWRVCTHGACDVEPAGRSYWHCPCHGSRFDLEGRVLLGPATRPLRSFTVLRRDDTLFLRR